MSPALAAAAQLGLLVGALALIHRPLGNHMAQSFTSPRHWRGELLVYRVAGIEPDADQRWPTYARSAIAFSLVGVLVLLSLQRLQGVLPGSRGFPGVSPTTAWNTAVSFVTNTNWQSYAGETTMGTLVQMCGLAVQNFLSAAVGLAVAIALLRGFARSRTDRIGNFWTDITRATTRILLPLSVLAAIVLVVGGVVQTLGTDLETTTISGAARTIFTGPVASQEAIKELGTNGGGFFNANAAHPFEGPSAWVSLFQVFLLLAIPFSLPRTFGRLVGDLRQGRAILAVMAGLWLTAVALLTAAEFRAAGAVPQLAGGALEGKEVRFGEALSALYAASTTGTSTGAVNAMHDSLTAAGGGVALANILLGEVTPGGVGSGLYGILVLAVLAVFLAGLMVGRTPEYLGKKIGRREVTIVGLYVLAVPALLLIGAAVTAASPGMSAASVQDAGPHGLTEVLYAYASASNNNGSAFAGFDASTDTQNVVLGAVMLLGRFVPMVLVVALAGSLAQQKPLPASAGSLPTHTPVFVGLLLFVTVVVAGLTYFPALSLAPIAEALR